MEFYVYILYSKGFDRYYKGQTQDLHQRIWRHSQGLEKSTLAYRPWKLLWYTTMR